MAPPLCISGRGTTAVDDAPTRAARVPAWAHAPRRRRRAPRPARLPPHWDGPVPRGPRRRRGGRRPATPRSASASRPGRTVSATVDDWTVASLPHLLVAVSAVRRRGRTVGRARARPVRAVRGRRGARRGRPGTAVPDVPRAAAGAGRRRRRPATSAPGRAASCRTRGSRRGASTTSRCPPRGAGSATPTAGATGSRRPEPRGPHHHSLSSLPSMARRWVREHDVAVGTPASALDRGRPRQGLGLRRLRAAEVAGHGLAHALEATPAATPRGLRAEMPTSRYVVTRDDVPARGVVLTRDQGEGHSRRWPRKARIRSRGRGRDAPAARPARPCGSYDGPGRGGGRAAVRAPLPGARSFVRARVLHA